MTSVQEALYMTMLWIPGKTLNTPPPFNYIIQMYMYMYTKDSMHELAE